MLRRVLTVSLTALAVGMLSMASAHGDEVKPIKEWSGSVDDEALAKDAPRVITDAKSFESLWKNWKLKDKAPALDFSKQLVVLTTTRGSRLSMNLNLTNKGDLQVLAKATRDLRPGFRYVIASVSREGVKTVNGKELK